MKTPYPALFEPMRLGHLRLKNRIISTSHAPAYAEGGRPGERYQRYHEEKAKGGLSLTMFGGASSISPDSPPSFGQIQVGDDGIVPFFKSFAERIHAHGVGLMCQLSHAGRRTHATSGNWLPAVAPSPIREPAHGSMPKAMSSADIRRVVADYAAAARRCKEGGLDGCELLASGHLIGQFWSGLSNRRTDAYGGSFENRLRFGMEVLEAVREATGSGFIVSLRFTANEFLEGGIDEAEGLEIARRHAASGLVHCLNVSGGANWTKAGVAETVPSMAFASGRFIELAGKVRHATGLPVLHAEGVPDLATANFAVSEGHVDLIGMTRAQIADPHMVKKHLAGEDEAIRPCVGAGYCIDRIYRGGDALCAHNPATGRELHIPHSVEPSPGRALSVVIVGAGPAGMEAAWRAAARGHRVRVLEAQGEPGGQILLGARLAWRQNLLGVARWLYDRCQALGVEFTFNRFAEAEDILALAPDVVILATGGLPNFSTVEGGEDHAISVWDVLSGNVAPSGSFLIFDDTGGQSGPSAAEFLSGAGAEVELVTPDRCVAEDVGVTNHAIHLRNLYAAGARLTPDQRLRRIGKDGNRLMVELVNEYSGETQTRKVDHVVVEAGTLPFDDLYEALVERSVNGEEFDPEAFMTASQQPAITDLPNAKDSYALFRIGDALATRGLHAAVFDAARLCSRL
jgi:2,4-dienoyl-CoA reductase-like NADH-dependent reductase (Old Yellow Enzyme family)/thioredoxin reductase